MVTALLAVVYLTGVLGLPALIGSESELVVAGSTLAVAALFNPVRRWVQGFVDRRFNRSRYDSARVVEAFSTRLRHQVDLAGLTQRSHRSGGQHPASGDRVALGALRRWSRGRQGWMRRIGPRLIVAAMVILYLASAVLIEVLHARSGQLEDDPLGSIASPLAFTAYMTVGVLIVLRRPGNVMGWILVAIALPVMMGALASEYVVYAFEELSRDAPGLIPAAWLAEWYWYPTLALVLFFTPFLFPNGRPASPGWRPVLWLGIAITGVTTAMAALSPTLGEPDFSLPNPIGVAGSARCGGKRHR